MAKNKDHHLEKRKDVWYFKAKVNGKKFKKSLHTSSVTEARSLRDDLLKTLQLYGDLSMGTTDNDDGMLFGELAQRWAKLTEKRVKTSTMKDYRSAMNYYILQQFGNIPIRAITYLDIEEFVSELECSPKRINNILVPFRSVFKLAHKSGLIDQNIMSMVDNRKTAKPQIHPLSIDEVSRFLEHVNPFYTPFFTVAFYTGMRGGEMSALKWDNVDLDKKTIKVVETRVYGEEGRPKTNSSYRTIEMLPMVHEALKEQAARTMFKSKYVFLNIEGRPIDVETLRKTSWTTGLESAKIDYRPMIQTRHTFATLMVSAGENLGWVQRMMGHASLKMIIDNYYAYIPNITHHDGSLFMDIYEKREAESAPKVPQEGI